MSSREKELIDKMNLKFDIEAEVKRERRIWATVEKNDLIDLCEWLVDSEFIHLSSISVTDRPEDGIYELAYHIWSYDERILITVKTKVDRDDPMVESVAPIWKESAQIHEREGHEMFGVKFKNNPDLTPLFLEDWSGPPPFRKDFDWRKYVREEFYDREDDRERVYFD